MNLNIKKGFSLVESLTGFVLFSVMLMLYMPSFHTEVTRIENLKEETAKWQIFKDLVYDHYSFSGHSQLASLVNRFEKDHPFGITDFKCQSTYCYINFSDGSDLYVELQQIE